MLPAIAQGVIRILLSEDCSSLHGVAGAISFQCRSDDDRVLNYLKPLSHADTFQARSVPEKVACLVDPGLVHSNVAEGSQGFGVSGRHLRASIPGGIGWQLQDSDCRHDPAEHDSMTFSYHRSCNELGRSVRCRMG